MCDLELTDLEIENVCCSCGQDKSFLEFRDSFTYSYCVDCCEHIDAGETE